MPSELDIGHWLERRVGEIEKEAEEKVIVVIYKAMDKAGKDTESRYFRNITDTMNVFRPNHDLFVEGDPYRGVRWKSLNKEYVKRKGHDRKWFNTGELQSYLARARVSAYFPKTTTMIDGKNVIYSSGLESERKHFDDKNVEKKISGNPNNEKLRPLFEPMRRFYTQVYLPTRLTIAAQQALEKVKL